MAVDLHLATLLRNDVEVEDLIGHLSLLDQQRLILSFFTELENAISEKDESLDAADRIIRFAEARPLLWSGIHECAANAERIIVIREEIALLKQKQTRKRRQQYLRHIWKQHSWEDFPESLPLCMRKTKTTDRVTFGNTNLIYWGQLAKETEFPAALAFLSGICGSARVRAKDIRAAVDHFKTRHSLAEDASITQGPEQMGSSHSKTSGVATWSPGDQLRSTSVETTGLESPESIEHSDSENIPPRTPGDGSSTNTSPEISTKRVTYKINKRTRGLRAVNRKHKQSPRNTMARLSGSPEIERGRTRSGASIAPTDTTMTDDAGQLDGMWPNEEENVNEATERSEISSAPDEHTASVDGGGGEMYEEDFLIDNGDEDAPVQDASPHQRPVPDIVDARFLPSFVTFDDMSAMTSRTSELPIQRTKSCTHALKTMPGTLASIQTQLRDIRRALQDHRATVYLLQNDVERDAAALPSLSRHETILEKEVSRARIQHTEMATMLSQSETYPESLRPGIKHHAALAKETLATVERRLEDRRNRRRELEHTLTTRRALIVQSREHVDEIDASFTELNITAVVQDIHFEATRIGNDLEHYHLIERQQEPMEDRR